MLKTMMNTNRAFKRQRALDMRIAARKIMNRYRGKALPFGRLVDLTLESAAPGYYLSANYAIRMMSLYRRSMLPLSTSDLKRQMWDEINCRVDSVMRHYRLNDLATAVRYVLAIGDASRFFVSRNTARRVLEHPWMVGGKKPER